MKIINIADAIDLANKYREDCEMTDDERDVVEWILNETNSAQIPDQQIRTVTRYLELLYEETRSDDLREIVYQFIQLFEAQSERIDKNDDKD